ncbi:hypothetical protein VNO77_42072 [Canavalia gladiata]|uniref:Uncharacterized protein n=1 Tax=Canavalia gladiata TaxID=3824 RepID=A0AAN9PS35_CANGL
MSGMSLVPLGWGIEILGRIRPIGGDSEDIPLRHQYQDQLLVGKLAQNTCSSMGLTISMMANIKTCGRGEISSNVRQSQSIQKMDETITGSHNRLRQVTVHMVSQGIGLGLCLSIYYGTGTVLENSLGPRNPLGLGCKFDSPENVVFSLQGNKGFELYRYMHEVNQELDLGSNFNQPTDRSDYKILSLRIEIRLSNEGTLASINVAITSPRGGTRPAWVFLDCLYEAWAVGWLVTPGFIFSAKIFQSASITNEECDALAGEWLGLGEPEWCRDSRQQRTACIEEIGARFLIIQEPEEPALRIP